MYSGNLQFSLSPGKSSFQCHMTVISIHQPLTAVHRGDWMSWKSQYWSFEKTGAPFNKDWHLKKDLHFINLVNLFCASLSFRKIIWILINMCTKLKIKQFNVYDKIEQFSTLPLSTPDPASYRGTACPSFYLSFVIFFMYLKKLLLLAFNLLILDTCWLLLL